MTPSLDRHVVIDADGHVREPDDLWRRQLARTWGDQAPRVQSDAGGLFISVGGREVPARQKYARQVERLTPAGVDRFREARADGFSAPSQLAAMDREGVDHSVLFPTHGLALMGVDGVPPALTTAIAHVYNTWLAGFCAEGQGRLSGVGMVDPRNVDEAIQEARRCVDELGFVGVFVRPNPVEGRPWHDAAYEPLWSAIEELDVPLCFHEGGAVLLPQVAVDRFDVHAFWHVCTHPMEQQMAMVSMLLGGVAERHPGLRMAFLECGASWLPYWMWRMDEHVEAEPAQFSGLSLLPSEYVRRQCFVGVDSDEEPGMAAAASLGGRRAVWGSDYPHADSKFPHALDTLRHLPGATDSLLRQILMEAPLELFGDRLGERMASQPHPAGDRPGG